MSIARDIRNGAYDEDLDDIQEALVKRRKIIATNLFTNVQTGARVRFNQTVRPTYLRGMEATVVGKKVSKLVVQLDRPVGRYGSQIRVPASLVEVVQGVVE